MNKVHVIGWVKEDPQLDHEVCGEKFFKTHISIERTSGTIDLIPCLLSERLEGIEKIKSGAKVNIYGSFRSFNDRSGEKSRLILNIFAENIDVVNEESDFNKIEAEGYICKEPVYRTTPLGREIADVLLAVNRAYGKSDYIPCICWGRNARYAESLEVGTCLKINGRIQSREYIKQISEDCSEQRMAYEVSISRLEVIDDANGKDQENETE